MLLIAGLICLVTGVLAARKGYSFLLWTFSGGIVGLTILAFLPFTNKGNMPYEKAIRNRTVGNAIGGVISAVTVFLILWPQVSVGPP